MEIVLYSNNESLLCGRKEFVLDKKETCFKVGSSIVFHRCLHRLEKVYQ